MLLEILYAAKLLSKIWTQCFVNHLSGWKHDNQLFYDCQYPRFDLKSFIQCLLERKCLTKDLLHILDVCLNITEIAVISEIFVIMFIPLSNPPESQHLLQENECWLPHCLASGKSLDDPPGTEGTLYAKHRLSLLLYFCFHPPRSQISSTISHTSLCWSCQIIEINIVKDGKQTY